MERLSILRSRLPDGVTLDELLWDDEIRDPLLERDAVAAQAYGWIEGFADAEDVLVTALVEDVP